MSSQSPDRETLKAIALQMINDARRAFALEPLSAFVPGYANEDDDCVIEAIRELTGHCFFWGETDSEDRTWIGPLDGGDEVREACEKLAAGWGTAIRKNEHEDWEVFTPAPLADFAGRVALEGEYPELVKEN